MIDSSTILVVDDSELERRLIGGLLENSARPYRVDYAADGREALERIAETPPDLVVTDLVMPEVDGLELLKAIGERWPGIPVVLLTAFGDEATAVQALDLGAATYIPKARQAATLPETVRRVLSRARAARSRERLTNCLSRMDCWFTLPNDPALFDPLVDLVEQNLAGDSPAHQTEQVRIGVALEEALFNAFYHGNLELSEPEYRQAREEGRLKALAEERRRQSPFRDRRIHVEIHIALSEVRLRVHDDGPGCSLSEVSLTRDEAAYFEAGHDRGLRLMRGLMDEVQFNESGNEVTLLKRRGQPVGAQP